MFAVPKGDGVMSWFDADCVADTDGDTDAEPDVDSERRGDADTLPDTVDEMEPLEHADADPDLDGDAV